MRFETIVCDRCHKKLERKDVRLRVLVRHENKDYSFEESEPYDLCDECAKVFERTIAIGLGYVTDGDGRKLKVVAEEE